MKTPWIRLTLFLLIVALAGCGGGGEESTTPPGETPGVGVLGALGEGEIPTSGPHPGSLEPYDVADLPGLSDLETSDPADAKKVRECLEIVRRKDFRKQNEARKNLKALGEKAVGPLVEALTDPKDEVATFAARMLEEIGDPRATGHLIRALRTQTLSQAATAALTRIGEEAVEPLISALKSSDKVTRQLAAHTLGRMRAKEAAPFLVEILTDPDRRVRQAASNALMYIGQPGGEGLLRLLDHPDPEFRVEAARLLGRIGDEKAVQPLADALRDENRRVRVCVAEALSKVGDATAETACIGALKDPDPWIRKYAAAALIRFGGLLAVPDLLRLLGDQDRECRRNAIMALGRIADPRAVEPLLEIARDTKDIGRHDALRALAQIGDPRTVETLVQMMLTEMRMRPAAAAVLAKTGKAALEPLTRILRDTKDPDLQTLVVRTLGNTGVDEAAEPLIDFLEKGPPNLHSNAASALQTLTGQHFGREPEKWRRWTTLTREARLLLQKWRKETAPETAGRIQERISALGNRMESEWTGAIQALVELGKSTVPPLNEALKHKDWFVRAKAAMALGRIKDRAATGSLVLALDRQDRRVKVEIVRALGRIDDPRAAGPLVEELFNHNAKNYTAPLEVVLELGESALPHIIREIVKRKGRVGDFALQIMKKIGKPAVGPLLEVLKHENPYVALAAAKALAKIGDPVAVEPIRKLLGSKEVMIRIEVLKLLSGFKDPRVIATLCELLKTAPPAVQIHAARALGEAGQPEAVEPLIEALGKTAPGQGATIVQALGRLGDPRAYEPILKNFGSGLTMYRDFYLTALIQLDRARAAEMMLDALRDPKSKWRTEAGRRLAEMKEKKALESLLELARDPSMGIRLSALSSLGKLGDPRAVPELIAAFGAHKAVAGSAYSALKNIGSAANPDLCGALANENLRVRIKAAALLAEIGDPPCVEPLVKALADPDPTVRRHAVAALGNIGEPGAVEGVLGRAGDENAKVRKEVAAALGKLGGSRSLEILARLLADRDQGVSRAAMEGLEKSGTEAVPVLLEGLKGEFSWTRANSASALWKTGDPRCVDPLVRALRDGYPKVRAEAVKGLYKLKARTAFEPLLECLTDEEEIVRREAAVALGTFDDPKAIAALIDRFSDRDEVVRRHAEQALRRIGSNAVEPLIRALKGPGRSMQHHAANALGNLRDPRGIAPLIEALTRSGERPIPSVSWALGRMGPPAVGPLIEALKGAENLKGKLIASILSSITSSRIYGAQYEKWKAWYEKEWKPVHEDRKK